MDWWIKVNNVVQFKERHELAGCLGVIADIKDMDGSVQYLIKITIPFQQSMDVYAKHEDFEYIGDSVVNFATE